MSSHKKTTVKQAQAGISLVVPLEPLESLVEEWREMDKAASETGMQIGERVNVDVALCRCGAKPKVFVLAPDYNLIQCPHCGAALRHIGFGMQGALEGWEEMQEVDW